MVLLFRKEITHVSALDRVQVWWCQASAIFLSRPDKLVGGKLLIRYTGGGISGSEQEEGSSSSDQSNDEEGGDDCRPERGWLSLLDEFSDRRLLGCLDNCHFKHSIIVRIGHAVRIHRVYIEASVKLGADLGIRGNNPGEARVDSAGGVALQGRPDDYIITCGVFDGGLRADLAVQIEHVAFSVQQDPTVVGDGARVSGFRSDALNSDLDREALADPEVDLMSHVVLVASYVDI